MRTFTLIMAVFALVVLCVENVSAGLVEPSKERSDTDAESKVKLDHKPMDGQALSADQTRGERAIQKDSAKAGKRDLKASAPKATTPWSRFELLMAGAITSMFVILLGLVVVLWRNSAFQIQYANQEKYLLAAPKSVVDQLHASQKDIHSLDKLVREFAALIGQGVDRNSQQVVAGLNQLAKEVTALSDRFSVLQANLDRVEEENTRLKSGYDISLMKKFLRRFANVHALIEDSLLDDETSRDQLEDIQELFADALDECGLEAFEPPEGVNFKEVEGLERPKIKKAPSKDVEFQIIEVLEKGYRQRTPGGYEIIKEARVRIYGAYEEEAPQPDESTTTQQDVAT